MSSEMEVEPNQIDESLYSRQLYVMGLEAQRRMGSSEVLFIGMDGLGVEIAKNVILAGVKSVTIYDPNLASMEDLSAHFYLSESDIGTRRDEACVARLVELNQYVRVQTLDESELTSSNIGRFSVVVMSNARQSEQLRINTLCRERGVAFVSSETRGVFATVFNDFGDSFVVADHTDLPPASFLVGSVSQDEHGVVTTADDAKHNLEDGDWVKFSDIEGMTELNSDTPVQVTVTGPTTFTIGDTRGFSAYTNRGYVNQVKMPRTVQFKPMAEAMTAPEIFVTDFLKEGRSELLHLAFQALHRYWEENGCLPRPGHNEDATKVLAFTRELNSGGGEGGVRVEGLEDDAGEHAKVVRLLARSSRAVISPMTAFLGGMVGQEVLKACSGKFMPIKQFTYFDAVEALPVPDDAAPEEFQPMGCRYDGQIMAIGRTLQRQLGNLNYFLVGAGAIGCEMLKNWAMMGVGAGEQGALHITDMDRIEPSNLNRQFLFRTRDMHAPKSVTAANAAKAMNPDVKITAYEERVGAESETLFNDAFFNSLSGVCTALDNVEARLYMDSRCVFYKKPMLESGTLGTKGNTQVIVPHMTENYGATRDPPEAGIPICTLKNFPSKIEHTLQWARDWFEGAFMQAPMAVNSYLGQSDFLATLDANPSTKLTTLETVRSNLVASRPLTFDECIVWARLRFEEMFHNQISQLLHNFPEDQVTSSGVKFWSGSKRAPRPIAFDPTDATHMDFVVSVANLRAKNYGLVGRTDVAYFLTVLPNVIVPEFAPREGVKIAVTEAEAKEEGGGSGSGAGQLQDVDASVASVVAELPPPSSLAGFRLEVLEFEKDDDSHMSVITATSNLRARNYQIPESDMHQSRLIAGKIIPAIATTTALVTGLVCLELLKVVQRRPIEAYKNMFVNLALPLVIPSEPTAPAGTKAMVKGKEWNWTAWDCIDVDAGRDLTLKEFMEHFESEYNLEISMLSCGVSILYSFFANKAKVAARMPKPMSALVEEVSKKPVGDSKQYLVFEICTSDIDSGDEVEVPYVRYKFR